MEESNKNTKANEPLVPYTKTLNIFHSFEEQEAHELKEMAAFSSIEILQHLRQCINLAYGMHGYNPDNLPKKHTITNIKYID